MALATADQPEQSEVEGRTQICMHSGQAGQLERALKAVEQMNVDLGILTEAKLMDITHTQFPSGCHVVGSCWSARSGRSCSAPWRFTAQADSVSEETWANVISSQLVSAACHLAVVEACIPPFDLDAVESFIQAMGDLPQEVEPLLLGDLNVDLSNPRDDREQATPVEMVTLGLGDLLLHLHQHCGFWHGTAWMQHHEDEMA